MNERISRVTSWWSSLSATWKVLGAILTAVGAVWTAALAYAAKSAEYATDAEVSASDAKVAADMRGELVTIKTDVAELKAVRVAQVSERDREQLAKAAEIEQWNAVFKHLVSIQAADREQKTARKAEASAFARNAFVQAIKDGMKPVAAAEFALDSRPPWRR